MVDTIERVIHLFSVTAFFFSPGIFRYPLHNPRPYFNFFYPLFLWSVYVYGIYYVVIFWPELFNDFIAAFGIIMSFIVTIISMIIMIHKQKKFHLCIRKLALVDDTLEKLGIPKEYHKIRNSVKQMLIIWFMMICVTLTTDSLLCIEVFKDIRAMIIPLVMDYCLWINTLMDIIFMLLLRHLHSELCQVARDINSLFGIQMTLQMISYFIIIIIMCHMQFKVLCFIQVYVHKVVTLKLLVCTNVWLTVYLTRLILLNHICESVSAKAQKTRTVLYNLTNFTRYANMREQILQFVLQISLRPLQFSGVGFHFGYEFIRKFFLWVITTIIFLMQSKSSPISRTLIFEGKNMTCD